MFLIKYIKENGYPPTLEEIADGVGVKGKVNYKYKIDGAAGRWVD